MTCMWCAICRIASRCSISGGSWRSDARPKCSTGRSIRIPRRCCRRCHRSMGTLAPRVERIRLSGDLPSAANPPSGCVFNTRCPRKLGAICEEQEPPYADAGGGHRIRCHIGVDELRVLQCGGGCARYTFEVLRFYGTCILYGLLALPVSGAGRMIACAWGRLQPFDALVLLWNLFWSWFFSSAPVRGGKDDRLRLGPASTV